MARATTKELRAAHLCAPDQQFGSPGPPACAGAVGCGYHVWPLPPRLPSVTEFASPSVCGVVVRLCGLGSGDLDSLSCPSRRPRGYLPTEPRFPLGWKEDALQEVWSGGFRQTSLGRSQPLLGARNLKKPLHFTFSSLLLGDRMVVVGHEPASNPATTTFQLSDPGEVTSSPEAMVSSSANRNITIETEMLLLNFQNGCGD